MMSQCEHEPNKNEKPLKLEDLHPALQFIFNVGAEILLSLQYTIKRGGDEKTILNLTSAVEKIPNKIVGHEKRYYLDTGLPYKVPIYAEEFRRRVNFGFVKDQGMETGLSVVLHDVKDDQTALNELKVIAHDLQRVYDLSYQPEIYHEGKKVELVKKEGN